MPKKKLEDLEAQSREQKVTKPDAEVVVPLPAQGATKKVKLDLEVDTSVSRFRAQSIC